MLNYARQQFRRFFLLFWIRWSAKLGSWRYLSLGAVAAATLTFTLLFLGAIASAASSLPAQLTDSPRRVDLNSVNALRDREGINRAVEDRLIVHHDSAGVAQIPPHGGTQSKVGETFSERPRAPFAPDLLLPTNGQLDSAAKLHLPLNAEHLLSEDHGSFLRRIAFTQLGREAWFVASAFFDDRLAGGHSARVHLTPRDDNEEAARPYSVAAGETRSDLSQPDSDEDSKNVRNAEVSTSDGERYVRILALLGRGRARSRPLFCFVETSENMKNIGMAYPYLLSDNHEPVNSNLFSSFMLSCQLPDSMKHIPAHIYISQLPYFDKKTSLSLQVVDPTHGSSNFTVCVPPLYGHMTPDKIIEFIEYHKLIGVDRVSIFIFDPINTKQREISLASQKDMMRAVKMYSNEMIIDAVRWVLPIDRREVFNYGQMLMHQVCLYENLHRAAYMLYLDLDQFAVPVNTSSLSEVVRQFDWSEYSNLRLRTTVFPIENRQESMIPLRRFERTRLFNSILTKFLIRPALVFSVGIHHVTKNMDLLHKTNRHTKSALVVHHYKLCVAEDWCRAIEEDRSILRYGNELQTNVDARIKRVFTSRNQ